MPLVSVIIPVYNGEKTIRETIESVLIQTLCDIEVIVINDGSQDATLEIVEQLQDTRLQVFSYPNAGSSASRNRGIALASSEYISFIDADDLWTTDKLEAQFKALEANPQAAVAYSWSDFIDESGHFLRAGSHMTVTGDVYPKLLTYYFLENGSNALFRKQALLDVGGFDESLVGAEDWDLCLRVAARYHFVAVPSAQVLYRQPLISMSSNVPRLEVDSLKVIEQAFNQAPESLQHLKKQALANLYIYLTFKSSEGSPSREQGLRAARCLWHTIHNDPSVLRRRSRLMAIVMLKILAAIILPSQSVKDLLKTVK
jgi:glycosyltransferase involved in cell wall biosynthesis